MTLKSRFQVQSSPVSMANPRVRAVALVMLDNPALLERAAYRQIQSLWAGHLCALTFWTCTFGAYEDLFHERYGEKNMLGISEHNCLDFAVMCGSFSPAQELPHWMRRPPSRFFLKLPKDNPFQIALAKAPDDLTQDDLPFLLLHIAEQAFVPFFPPSLARLLMLAEAGHWYSLLTHSSMENTAKAFGMGRRDYGRVVSDAHRFKGHGAVALSVRDYGRISPDAPEAKASQYEKARNTFFGLYNRHISGETSPNHKNNARPSCAAF